MRPVLAGAAARPRPAAPGRRPGAGPSGCTDRSSSHRWRLSRCGSSSRAAPTTPVAVATRRAGRSAVSASGGVPSRLYCALLAQQPARARPGRSCRSAASVTANQAAKACSSAGSSSVTCTCTCVVVSTSSDGATRVQRVCRHSWTSSSSGDARGRRAPPPAPGSPASSRPTGSPRSSRPAGTDSAGKPLTDQARVVRSDAPVPRPSSGCTGGGSGSVGWATASSRCSATSVAPLPAASAPRSRRACACLLGRDLARLRQAVQDRPRRTGARARRAARRGARAPRAP